MHFCETLRNSYALSRLLPMCMLAHTVLLSRVASNGGIRGGIWKEELSELLNLTKPRKGQGTRTTKGLTKTTSYPLQWSGRVNSLSKFFSEVPILPYEYGYCLYENAEGECSEATSTHYNYYSSHTFIILLLH